MTATLPGQPLQPLVCGFMLPPCIPIRCQSADLQGYVVPDGFGAGCRDLECQAQLTAGLARAMQSWHSRVRMWHACQSSAPAENAHPTLLAWNLVPAAQAPPPPPPPSLCNPDPSLELEIVYSPLIIPAAGGTLSGSPEWGYCPGRLSGQDFGQASALLTHLLCDLEAAAALL